MVWFLMKSKSFAIIIIAYCLLLMFLLFRIKIILRVALWFNLFSFSFYAFLHPKSK